MTSPTDAEAIAGSLADPSLFSLVFERHYSAIHHYVRRRVGAADADELAAETFVQAFLARGRYDAGAGTPLAWLYGVATNLLRQYRRTEERRLRAYARACFAAAPEGMDDADARVDAQRLGGALAEALASLPSADRDVLLLHAWADLSHAEIAAALGIPAATVRSRLLRARRRVRERLGPFGKDSDEGNADTGAES